MVSLRPRLTPSELAEAAAKAVVTARGYEHTEGEPYLDAFGWALGGQVEYATGLGLFATAVLDVTAAADSPGESVSDAGVRLSMNVMRSATYEGAVFVTALGEQGAWHTDAAVAIAEAERIRSVFPSAPVTFHAGFDVA